MLSKINRIKKRKDFEEIFRNSKIFKDNLFIFRIRKNTLGVNRFGFVVSQKVSKKAVIRNKVKRRLGEAIKGQAKDIKSGVDLVIIALPQIVSEEFSTIKDAVKKALKKCLLL